MEVNNCESSPFRFYSRYNIRLILSASIMDLHEAHVSLEMLDFAGLSRFVSDLLSPAVSPCGATVLSSESKARVGKKLKLVRKWAIQKRPSES